MADIAVGTLERGVHGPGGAMPEPRRVHLDEGPVAAGVWTDGDLGFVLLLHRRDDGFVASELYYSLNEKSGPGTESEPAVFRKNLTSRVAVVAVRPGERLRVVPVEQGGSTSPAASQGLDLFSSIE
ncbi:hypothetical protein [Streptomyces sp. NPDC020996]|uniref:hypothetical protein n=1 Tax=Streptomyces sp. NPDC020996 TaxID=3154791 RepID=UPI00340BAE1A